MTQDDLSCEEESGTAKHEVPFGEQLTLRSLLIGALDSRSEDTRLNSSH